MYWLHQSLHSYTLSTPYSAAQYTVTNLVYIPGVQLIECFDRRKTRLYSKFITVR